MVKILLFNEISSISFCTSPCFKAIRLFIVVKTKILAQKNENIFEDHSSLSKDSKTKYRLKRAGMNIPNILRNNIITISLHDIFSSKTMVSFPI